MDPERFDGERVWFFTEADSPKVAEIRRNRKVNLAYASQSKNTYVSLTGDARIYRDEAKIEALWSDALKAFFPKGKHDPNLTMLEVEVRTAEYWDGPGSLIGKLVSFVVARVTGNEEVLGENRILNLKGPRVTSRLPPSHAGAKKPAKKAAKKVAKKKAGKTAAAKKAPVRGAKKTAGKKTAGKKTAKARRKQAG